MSEKNATMTQAQFTENAAGKFVQFIADNVDQNVVTLDREGTVHMMGIIVTITPGIFNNSIIVPRVDRLRGDTCPYVCPQTGLN